MNNNEHIDEAEFEKLIHLLKEYTVKLRDICEHRADSQYRMVQALGISIAMIAALSSAVFLFFEKIGNSHISFYIILPFLFLGFGVMLFASNRRRFRDSFDADRIAASVERLTRLASQYAEHSSYGISNRFELDLRIAEAEGTLRYYKRLFQVRADWTSKK